MARNTAGELLRPEDSEMSVAEDTDLQLPFLLPEDGYTSDTTKGIPQGLCAVSLPSHCLTMLQFDMLVMMQSDSSH